MKADISLCLFFLSCVLAPGLTDSFVKIPLKKTSYTPKTFPEIEAYTADTIGALKQIRQTLDNVVEQRRATICCNDGLVYENKIALALRSAFFNSIIVLNRLQEAITQYQAGDTILDICRACDISPFNPPCNITDWRCSSGKCVPRDKLCDGKDDCEDSSDEVVHNCTDTPCGLDYLCEEDQVCINSWYVCDGNPDCSHGSDETHCYLPTDPETPDCEEDQFRCQSDGLCLPETLQCDGKQDCDDGSDENSCDLTPACAEDEFQCVTTGRCLPITFHCDFEKDCPDGSDESLCPRPCQADEFRCKSNGVCVPGTFQCDDEADCDDGSDEDDCSPTIPPPTTTITTTTTTCSENQFQCANSGKCVPDSWLCDGDKDCEDASDEEDCPRICQADEFRCKSDGVCVPGTYQCDDKVDCDDGSDEDDCVPITPPPTTTTTTSTTVCSSDQFQCVFSGKCVSISWLCDDEEDCPDGSDEANCNLKPSCEEGKIQCPSSGDCIPSHWRCDGYADCKDSSDEENCTVVVKEVCKDSPCSHGCLETPWHVQGFQCTCPDGMTLLAHDRHTCVQRGAKGIKGIKSNIKG
ncbi:low-density lipoprotein receptor-related protein 8-like isoform X2 [Portunus trituberculatus]|uniref:low-density lipoprotein receptor-related protein 8-like isoform X2 n=1 Tax=Portunus trituberculatus TaxID=210409 RepID=UPI001E1CF44C|nr:low-density lipoprotein receptor-related protein 8-like isoform X2 [Portunus trituberculatus]